MSINIYKLQRLQEAISTFQNNITQRKQTSNMIK